MRAMLRMVLEPALRGEPIPTLSTEAEISTVQSTHLFMTFDCVYYTHANARPYPVALIALPLQTKKQEPRYRVNPFTLSLSVNFVQRIKDDYELSARSFV